MIDFFLIPDWLFILIGYIVCFLGLIAVVYAKSKL